MEFVLDECNEQTFLRDTDFEQTRPTRTRMCANGGANGLEENYVHEDDKPQEFGTCFQRRQDVVYEYSYCLRRSDVSVFIENYVKTTNLRRFAVIPKTSRRDVLSEAL